ncbi:hypothetical protein MPC1_5070004 [Methylocella tundrae]|nr:hypothetical protein MPC1_5070004 [Methylocella tundrae]
MRICALDRDDYPAFGSVGLKRLPVSGASCPWRRSQTTILAVYASEPDVRFGAAVRLDRTTGMVKVFGCLQAFENRPSTNPRACGNGLWGFRALPAGDDGAAGAVTARTRTRRARLCARRSFDWELAACEVQVFCHGVGEGRADGGRRNKERCGAR